MRWTWVLLLLSLLSWAARADTRTYVVAIGNNDPPPGAKDLQPLRFADDDAADFYSLMRPSARTAWLLTVLDAESQRRLPALAKVAAAPSLAQLRAVVRELRTIIDSDAALGHETVVMFFFSGHGTRGEGDSPPTVTLADGGLSRQILYDEILAALPARYLHLFVDACHAEAVVRPRDTSAETVPVGESDARAYAAQATLARFPRVGAVIATSSTTQTHEWDAYGHGVFTHELLSGLRGAADVNGDGLIEYSELHAFLAAANRSVRDERARLEVVARPPMIDRRAPIVDWRRLGGVRLRGEAARLGSFWLEDGEGQRIADVNAEPGSWIELVLPPAIAIYLRTLRGAEVRLPGGEQDIRFEELRLVQGRTRSRSAVDDALSRGLFSTSFGRRYYEGFVDHSDLPPVHFAEPEPPPPRTKPPRKPISLRGVVAPTLLSFGAAFSVVGFAFVGLALDARSDFVRAMYERASVDASRRWSGYEAGAIVAFSVTLGLVAGGVVLARGKPEKPTASRPLLLGVRIP